MPYNREKVFKNVGKGIKKFNQFEADKQAVDVTFSEWVALLNDSEDEREFLQLVADNIADDEDNIESMKISTVSLLRTYMLTGIREDLYVANRNIDIVLDRLIDSMIVEDDTVLENALFCLGAEQFDTKEQLDTWYFTGIVFQTNTDHLGRVFATLSVGGAGHQVSVYEDIWNDTLIAQGDIAGDGEVTLAEQGGSGLSGTVDLTWIIIVGDPGIRVWLVPEPDPENAGTGWIPLVTLSQQVHTEHKLVIECTDASTPGAEVWSVKINKKDETRLINLGNATTGVEFENVKYGIKFTINRRTAIDEYYDQANQLSAWSLAGLDKGVNTTPYGELYVTLEDLGGSTYKVTLYSTSQIFGGTIVAQGQRVGNGVITLAAVGGSGLTGSVTVAYSADDLKIVIIPNLEFAVGDKFYFTTFHDGAGVFQAFFVEEWDTALPSVSSGETVPNSWAT